MLLIQILSADAQFMKVDIRWLANTPDSKVHEANMGPIWDRQGPGGPHVDPMNFVIWDNMSFTTNNSKILTFKSLRFCIILLNRRQHSMRLLICHVIHLVWLLCIQMTTVNYLALKKSYHHLVLFGKCNYHCYNVQIQSLISQLFAWLSIWNFYISVAHSCTDVQYRKWRMGHH